MTTGTPKPFPRRRTLLLAAILAAILVVLAAIAGAIWLRSSGCTVDLRYGEKGSVAVSRGDTFSVCLGLASGTGYWWRIAPSEDAKAFQQAAEPTFKVSGPAMPGAPGTVRFELRATAAGTFSLVFRSVSPGGQSSDDDNVIVSVQVR